MVRGLIAHALRTSYRVLQDCSCICYQNYIPNIANTIGFRLSISQNANFRKNPYGKDHNPRGRAI